MRHISGFTLIEILIAVALFLAIGVSATVFSAKSVGEYALADAEDFLVGSLREARFESRLGKGTNPWGVHVDDDRITLFQGERYVSRDTAFDRSYGVNLNIAISGPEEVVFSRGTGLPSETGTITLSWKGNERTVVVNRLGIVER